MLDRRRPRCGRGIWRAALAALVLIPSPAGAGVVAIDAGTLGLTLGSLPTLTLAKNPAPVPIYVSSGNGSFVEPAAVFGPATVTLFTGVPQISGLTLAGFGNATVAVSCGGTGPCTGSGGLVGLAIINVLQILNLSIPLSVVGSPGATAQAMAGSIVVTVIGQGWTTGTAVVTAVTTTTPGTAVVTVTLTRVGSDARTPQHEGPISLVSGFRAITNVAGTLPGFAVQTLVFSATPEAGTLLLVGVGAAALAVHGWRRRKRK